MAFIERLKNTAGLSNGDGDGDGNGNVKRTRAHTVLHISLSLLHDELRGEIACARSYEGHSLLAFDILSELK